MIDEIDNEFLGQNIKGLMMALISQWNSTMDDARSETEFASVRPADIRVFAQLRGRTVKLSTVHREMGFSRQAAQQAVERLVAHNMLSVEALPGSRRDKLVTITEKGHRWRAIAAAQIRAIEADIVDAIGREATVELRRYLKLILDRTDFSQSI